MTNKLFTPGPLTTSDTVRAAMNEDWGSRDSKFCALTARVRAVLTDLVHGRNTHTTIPVQGAGTFAVEAAIATLVRAGDRLLVLVNGEYGRRIAEIARRLGKQTEVMEFDELEPVDIEAVAERLRKSPKISKVALVQLETTTGLLNPTERIARLVSDAGAHLLLDAMSGFGAYAIDVAALPVAAVIASSNKGLHGVPGIGFVIVNKNLLQDCAGNCASLSLDLYEQWHYFEKYGQWRFTPPTHCLAALDTALQEFIRLGGQPERLKHYEANANLVVGHLEALGFECVIKKEYRSSVILTFGIPAGDWFDFNALYDRLAEGGHYLYPGKLTNRPSFRIGCIGELQTEDFRAMLSAFDETVEELRHTFKSTATS